MTTPDSFGSGGAMGGAGGLAAGPGDDQGEAAVTAEAETGDPRKSGTAQHHPSTNTAAGPGTSGGLGQSGNTGPDLTEDDEETAGEDAPHRSGSAER